jgi:hypothetical protein
VLDLRQGEVVQQGGDFGLPALIALEPREGVRHPHHHRQPASALPSLARARRLRPWLRRDPRPSASEHPSPSRRLSIHACERCRLRLIGGSLPTRRNEQQHLAKVVVCRVIRQALILGCARPTFLRRFRSDHWQSPTRLTRRCYATMAQWTHSKVRERVASTLGA